LLVASLRFVSPPTFFRPVGSIRVLALEERS
jgi:hypothetical protein